MAGTYYYRSGERIPVTLAQTARVARVADERSIPDVEGWRAVPLTSNYTLLVNDEVASARSFRAGGDSALAPEDLELISQNIIAHERAREEREAFAGRRVKRAEEVELEQRPDVVSFPAALDERGEGLLFTTGEVVAQFPASLSREQLEGLCRDYNFTLERTLSFLPNGYVLRPAMSVNPFEFANTLVETYGALMAHPVFLEQIPERHCAAAEERSAPAIPANATLFGKQWHLHNVGQNGALPGQDINALAAWEITTGSPDITACIIDSGVTLSHESFRVAGKLVPGFDFEDQDAIPEPTTSTHGTACAAVAAAGPTSGQVLGVAPGCRIMPIRRTGLSNHLALAEAIAWAADHGADVVSCSFGIDGRPWVLPDVVRAAMKHATEQGRGGRGCPIFWAAGNGNEPVSDDEWACSQYTIAVAASEDRARRAPYSDFGPEISVCAPSSGGINGIVTAVNNGYTSQFGGTSAAAPVAAGVACLVLSLSPSLHWFEVRDLLQRAARRIDPTGGRYDARGHSHFYGYGQVDAFASLVGVSALLEVERATGVEALAADIAHFFHHIGRTPAGAALASYVSARRLDLLLALRSSNSFREALARVMRLIADAGAKLAAGQTPLIPDAIWSAVEVVVRTLRTFTPRNFTNDRSERSVSPEEVEMPETQSLNEALQRLSEILGNPAGAGGRPQPPAPQPPAPQPPAPQPRPLPPSANGDGGLSVQQREEIARQTLYSMIVPIITPAQMQQMEKELVHLVELLKSLPYRPSVKRDIQRAIELATQQQGGSERDVAADARTTQLVELIRKDALGEGGERFVPALGLAVFMAAYTIGHQWKR